MRTKRKAAVHAGGNTLLSYFLNLLKGTAAGLIVTVAALLLFALLVKLFHIGDGAIPAVNMVIKIGSIFVAVLITLKFIRERGYLAGGLTGILCFPLPFFLFLKAIGALWILLWLICLPAWPRDCSREY